MSLRRIAVTMTILAALLGVLWIGVLASPSRQLERRSADLEREARAYFAAVRDERPRAQARLGRIRAELARGDLPEWAGEYSWRGTLSTPTCGFSEPQMDGEGIVVGPGGDVVWWFGGGAIEDAAFVDHGRMRSVDDEHVVVDWTIAPRHPRSFPSASPRVLLSDDCVRVAWDGGEFLVPAVRLPLFASPWGASSVDAASLAPRKGGWFVDPGSVGYASPARAPRPLPRVPERWRDFVRTEPIVAAARLAGSPEALFRAMWFMPRQESSWWNSLFGRGANGEGVWVRWRFEVSAGEAQGLRVGMPLAIRGAGGLGLGVVTSVAVNSAHVEWEVLELPGDSGSLPRGPIELTTGVVAEY